MKSKTRGNTRSARTDRCQRAVQLFDHFDLFQIARRKARSVGGNLTYQEFLSMTRKQQWSACGGGPVEKLSSQKDIDEKAPALDAGDNDGSQK